jgi:hypothetical protein
MNFEVPNDIVRGITDMVWVKAGIYPVKRVFDTRVIIIISKTGPRGGPRQQTTLVDKDEGILRVNNKRIIL